jgi:hypothetical protein
MLKKEVKAEITTSTIISIVILILGFGLVLLVFTQINWRGDVDMQVCHESVILRASTPNVLGAQNLVPLKCKTNKICVSSSSNVLGTGTGECDEFKNIEKEEIETVKVNNKDQIEKLLANEIVDCWSMLGEGKVNLFSQSWANSGLGTVYPTCIICSRVAFNSENLEEKKINLENVDILRYMFENKMPGEEFSYYRYLAGEGGLVSVEDSDFTIPALTYEKNGGELTADAIEITEDNSDKFESTASPDQELGILFMQISAPDHGKALANLATNIGIGAAGSFLLAPVLTTKVIGNTVLSHPLISLVLVTAGVATQQAIVAHNKNVAAGYCGDLETGDDRFACSVVRVVNYNAEEISKYCDVIESIP